MVMKDGERRGGKEEKRGRARRGKLRGSKMEMEEVEESKRKG